jgi:exosome complex protein LRP1
MATDTTKYRSKLAKLDKSLDELESQLEPLFAQSLPESLLALDTIQQAKLQVIIPYVVYDLVFGKRACSVLERTAPGADVLFARSQCI